MGDTWTNADAFCPTSCVLLAAIATALDVLNSNAKRLTPVKE
jgi:hypothetical protein